MTNQTVPRTNAGIAARKGFAERDPDPAFAPAPPDSLGETIALSSANGPESRPDRGFAERGSEDPAFAPAPPDSLGDPIALRQPNYGHLNHP